MEREAMYTLVAGKHHRGTISIQLNPHPMPNRVQ